MMYIVALLNIMNCRFSVFPGSRILNKKNIKMKHEKWSFLIKLSET